MDVTHKRRWHILEKSMQWESCSSVNQNEDILMSNKKASNHTLLAVLSYLHAQK